MRSSNDSVSNIGATQKLLLGAFTGILPHFRFCYTACAEYRERNNRSSVQRRLTLAKHFPLFGSAEQGPDAYACCDQCEARSRVCLARSPVCLYLRRVQNIGEITLIQCDVEHRRPTKADSEQGSRDYCVTAIAGGTPWNGTGGRNLR